MRPADEIAPDVAPEPAVRFVDRDGAAHVVAERGVFARMADLVLVKGRKVARCQCVERAPHFPAAVRQDIGHAALPFFVRQGESQAVTGKAGGAEKTVARAKPVHLRGAQVGAVGEVENGCWHGFRADLVRGVRFDRRFGNGRGLRRGGFGAQHLRA